ncbi:MAG: hypothetical protein WKF57_10185 [Nakamurella sp.]
MTTSNIAASDRNLTTAPWRSVRLALAVDATITALNGLAYLVGADVLDELLNLNTVLLRWAGTFLMAFGLVVAALVRRPLPSRAAVWIVIGINAAWAMDSVLMGVLGWGSPSAVGTAWIIGQGVLVAGFAAWQAAALTQRTRS